MKFAIASSGLETSSLVDKKFGRCHYFAIYDAENQELAFINNKFKDSLEGAGPAAAKFLCEEGVERIVAYEAGNKLKNICDTLAISIIILDNSKEFTIKDVINIINKNNI
ncbi:MAG: NifB/NifX family molybdenum-iron cluster-binding protein [Bacteroidales bacterium]|jgi:predicted Fe-Mo cluster-binding NifX family protein